MIPELRTSPRFAIALAVMAVLALAISLGLGNQLEDAMGSSTAAVVVLGLWCLIGAAVAITAIVDAYIKPEGELLGLVTSIAATVFALLAMLVLTGIVVGATGVTDEDVPADSRNAVSSRRPLPGEGV